MKTLMLRVCYLGLAVSTILASPGTEEPTQITIDPVADVLPDLKIADADALAESEVPAPLVLAPATGGNTNAPLQTNAPAKPPVPVQEPTVPANVQLSPAMADLVKLVQAGVSADVLVAYITNSQTVFHVNSDVIVYLKDLGVTDTVITALIQHESSPETAARKASATAVQPLPPGVAITAPVTNVYPQTAMRTLPAAGQTSYPGDISSVTDTNMEASAPPAVDTAPPVTENVSVNTFYSSLSPYGSWVDVDGYGLCWRPTVAVADPYWRPYNNCGRWLWSDRGWYWYSDYSWGWAPFHYGRWCSYPSMGWIWVPGSVWAPSWVTWRYYDGYCGWAPLPPGCGYRAGFGLTWYGSGVALGFGWGLGAHCYSYVPTHSFCDWNVSRHCLPAHRIHAVHHNAINVNRVHTRNNAIVNEGIEPNTIARASRTKIPTMKVKDQAQPADVRARPERVDARNNTITVARPQAPKNNQVAAVTPPASRGTGTKARPMNLSPNTTQANAPATVNRQGATPPNSTASPRPTTANNNSAIVRNNGTGGARPAVQQPAPNQAAAAQPSRSTVTPPDGNRPQAPTANVQRQTAPGQIARNNVATAPNNSPVGRAVTPPPQSAVRSAPPQTAPRTAPSQATPRSAPSQAAPAPRVNTSPMIRSYAQPQVSAPRASQPGMRSASPMAPPQYSARPQFSAPRSSFTPPSSGSAMRSAPSAPSVRSAPSAPSVSRSAPSGGNSGGGGGRVGGGGNSGGGGRGGPR